MSRIKRMAGALMISAALLNLAPMASAAEAETADHCLPFIDHPVVCLVVCTAQNQSVKACDVQLTCAPNPSVFCDALARVWGIVP